MFDLKKAQLAANTIRMLSAEAIQKAKSGHPGMPLGCADYALTLWYKYLRHNPKNPSWLGRDRFVLSAGHGSMLEYSLLHLFGYGLSIDDVKNFRQWESLTPGHPEFGHTAGVDITTGPLGSGFASAVGMAVAGRYFAARTGLDAAGLMPGKIFVISGDGCMMEGCTSEAASLAGHLKLDDLVVFYDDNSITIEGQTNLAFSEDVGARFAAYNWRVLRIADANDIAQCDAALAEAVKSDGRPTLIIGKTSIGFGAPNKQGKACAHGEPLGPDEVEALRTNLGMPKEEFAVLPEVREFLDARVTELVAAAAEWDKSYQAFLDADPARAAKVLAYTNRTVPADLRDQLLKAAPLDKPVASRASSGAILQKAAELVPALIGGAADLAPSTKTNLKNETDFTAENRAGRNLHFGIRELAMGLAGNGMALAGTAIPYTSTFFVFSDYMKPAIRLAALMKLHEIYVFTHDSFYVGEDGPTHEPIEQLAMLRSIPGLTVIRPAEAHEVADAWAVALQTPGPVVLALTRQDLPPYDEKTAAAVDVARGAYVISDDEDFNIILIATGSEVNLALETAKLLRENGGVGVRVVSMPSQELFLAQDQDYQEEVLPSDCPFRVTIEAGSTFGWHRFAGSDGLCIGLDHFGASAPYKVLAREFGFTPEAILSDIEAFYSCEDDDCGCEDGDCGCEDGDCGCGCHKE
ncbi:MAG: transketolase [Victivallaceae bacterium]|nr:transketolase [Victivallaceae bacterium]